MDDDREYTQRRDVSGDYTPESWRVRGHHSNRGMKPQRPQGRPSSQMPDNRFPPTMDAAMGRLGRIRPNAYAKTRNFIDGAVTRLSPYITHGFLSIPECIENLSIRNTLTLEDKIIYEFAWREYFHHVWTRQGDGILNDIRNPIWRGRYQSELPEDIRSGATGVSVIDAAVRMLYEDGYLHNHLRMWLASYIVHMRKVDWKAGAAWMYSHLLDGDLASNSLSWQWVAGTFAHKPYLFNADNVSRYWSSMDCKGTVIDTSYVDLEAIARGRNDLGAEPGHHARTEEPATMGIPQSLLDAQGFHVLLDHDLEAALDRQHLSLCHPWDLAEQAVGGHHRIAWLDLDFHERFAWSEKRWTFVLERMRQLTDQIWITRSSAFAKQPVRLHGLYFTETLNPGYTALQSHGGAHVKPAPRFFANPLQMQPSFTRFFDHAMAGREVNLSGQDASRHSA